MWIIGVRKGGLTVATAVVSDENTDKMAGLIQEAANKMNMELDDRDHRLLSLWKENAPTKTGVLLHAPGNSPEGDVHIEVSYADKLVGVSTE